MHIFKIKQKWNTKPPISREYLAYNGSFDRNMLAIVVLNYYNISKNNIGYANMWRIVTNNWYGSWLLRNSVRGIQMHQYANAVYMCFLI